MSVPTDDLSAHFFGCDEPENEREARIRVIHPSQRRRIEKRDPNGVFIFPTSRSDEAGERSLSPFYLGPCPLYDDFVSQTMENGWQYSKVYRPFLAEDQKSPAPKYFAWAHQGWESRRATLDPMGCSRRAQEVFRWWAGEPLDKIQARKRIYVPLYAEQAVKQPFFQELRRIWEQHKNERGWTLNLMDFDGYDYGDMSLTEVLYSPKKSLGHGFVLAMLLLDDPALRECELRLLPIV